MKVKIQNPKGIAIAIDRLQDWLQTELFATWNRDPDNEGAEEFIFYPLVYRNQDPARGGYIAELYTGGGQYKEVFFDDSKAGLAWFGLGSKIEVEGNIHRADVHLVIFANLKKLYPTIEHRADNEIRADFAKIFEAPILGFTLVSTEIWLQNVLREYPGARRENRLIAADMGDGHAFRLNLKLEINPSELC